jgi:hypothetical protein
MRKPIYVKESFYDPAFLPPDAGIAPPESAPLGDVEDMNRDEALDHDLDDDLDDDEDDEE